MVYLPCCSACYASIIRKDLFRKKIIPTVFILLITPPIFTSCMEQEENSSTSDSAITLSDTLAPGTYTGDQYIDRVMNADVEVRQSLIRRAHQNFLNLPVPSERVHNEILPEVRQKRLLVFPDFPQRLETQEASSQAMENWLQNQPRQLAAYLEFLDDQYQQYESSLP